MRRVPAAVATAGDTETKGFMARIHAHPQARLLEFLLWGVPGLLLTVLSLATYFLEWNQGAFPIIGVVIGLVFIGWGLLPPAKPRVPESEKPQNPKSRRR